MYSLKVLEARIQESGWGAEGVGVCTLSGGFVRGFSAPLVSGAVGRPLWSLACSGWSYFRPRCVRLPFSCPWPEMFNCPLGQGCFRSNLAALVDREAPSFPDSPFLCEASWLSLASCITAISASPSHPLLCVSSLCLSLLRIHVIALKVDPNNSGDVLLSRSLI